MPATLWDLLRFRGADALQNLHPLVVHYPIALLTTCLPIYLLAWILDRESLELTGLWLLGLGTLSGAVAVYTGLVGSEGVMLAPSVQQHILTYHKELMLAVLGMSTVLAVWALI